MDKFEIGDLVRTKNYGPENTVYDKVGLVMEMDTREWSSACVLIDEQRWWIPFEKLERVSNG